MGDGSFSKVLTRSILSLRVSTQHGQQLCCCRLPGARSACRFHPPVLSLYFAGEFSVGSKIHSACWCLLPRSRSPAAVQYPLCIHKNERENTHTKQIPLRRVSDSAIVGGSSSCFCLWYCWLHRVPGPHGTRVILPAPPSLLPPHRRCTKNCREGSKPQVSKGVVVTHSHGSMGGKTESQLEMYALNLRRMKQDKPRSLGCAFLALKPVQTLRFVRGRKRA